ncbi:MAG: carbamoyltransferase HypF [Candidatus Aminicenantes bacterium]|nr:carbamoyltransferase HypF [Candidatus Aminicenantes bacterium]
MKKKNHNTPSPPRAPCQGQGHALRITVSGVVQGVGFRPFVYRIAQKLRLRGWVKNIGYGVSLHLESENQANLRRFLKSLEQEKPPLALIEKVEAGPTPFRGFRHFRILKSRQEESFVFISPDISTCRSCFDETSDPAERRYRYPFTNCTDCGPRYTIVKSLPYDRARTTMAGFAMCPDCRREYENPLDRRYHAQPIACPVCGPRLSLVDAKTGKKLDEGLKTAVAMIRKGKILAIKGLGGFHLVCDPLNRDAVARLRRLKQRQTKPLALMARDMETIAKYAAVSPAEKRELLSARRPIVLLKKKRDIPQIAPNLDEMGFMLPYTPLHHLLLGELGLIVATSSNRKDAPIAKDEKEGIAELCDYILTHNRPIQSRADDSVLKVAGEKPLFVRRARGYVPYPQRVPPELQVPQQIMALGGELKDTISLYKNGYIVTSQFLGDLDEYQNFLYFEETIRHLQRLFSVKPDLLVCDLHPGFHTTRYARKSGLPFFQVQHHYAHVLAVLLEHGLPPGEKVLGVSLDGYGYGLDGAPWGGEFFLADYDSCARIARFREVPLPGGDQAARQPWRMALAYLRDAFGVSLPRIRSLEGIDGEKRRQVLRMIEAGVRSPLTSSCGRLFDAVSFLAGVAPAEVEFEAEAPMRLEALAQRKIRSAYPFSLEPGSSPWEISFVPAIRRIVRDLARHVPAGVIAARFHNTLARAIAAVAEKAAAEFGVRTAVLTGGVFLNRKLLLSASTLLEEKGLSVLRPVRYSPNDESISPGQVAYALARLKKERFSA